MIRIIASGVAAVFVLTAVAPAVAAAQNTGGAAAPGTTSINGNGGTQAPKQGELEAVNSNTKKSKMTQGFIDRCEKRIDYLIAFPQYLTEKKLAYFVTPYEKEAYPTIEKNSKGKDIKGLFGQKVSMVSPKAASGKNKGKINYSIAASNFRGAINSATLYYYKSGDNKDKSIDTAALTTAATNLQTVADMASSSLEVAISDSMSNGKDPKSYAMGENYSYVYVGRPSSDDRLIAPASFNTADALNKAKCQTKKGRVNVAFLRKRASQAVRMVKYYVKTERQNYSLAAKDYNNLKQDIKANRKDIARR